MILKKIFIVSMCIVAVPAFSMIKQQTMKFDVVDITNFGEDYFKVTSGLNDVSEQQMSLPKNELTSAVQRLCLQLIGLDNQNEPFLINLHNGIKNQFFNHIEYQTRDFLISIDNLNNLIGLTLNQKDFIKNELSKYYNHQDFVTQFLVIKMIEFNIQSLENIEQLKSSPLVQHIDLLIAGLVQNKLYACNAMKTYNTGESANLLEELFSTPGLFTDQNKTFVQNFIRNGIKAYKNSPNYINHECFQQTKKFLENMSLRLDSKINLIPEIIIEKEPIENPFGLGEGIEFEQDYFKTTLFPDENNNKDQKLSNELDDLATFLFKHYAYAKGLQTKNLISGINQTPEHVDAIIDYLLGDELKEKPLYLREFLIIKLLRSMSFDDWFTDNGNYSEDFKESYDNLISTLQNNKKFLFSTLLENIASKQNADKEKKILEFMLKNNLSEQDKKVFMAIAISFFDYCQKNKNVTTIRQDAIKKIFSESNFNPLIEPEEEVVININDPEEKEENPIIKKFFNGEPKKVAINPKPPIQPQPKLNPSSKAYQYWQSSSLLTKIIFSGLATGALGVFGYFMAKRYGYIKK